MGIAVALIIAVALLSAVGMGAAGCMRNREEKKAVDDNLRLAWEAYAEGDVEKSLEYAIGAEYSFEGTEPSAESADTHSLLFLLYYMAGLEEEALERIERFPPAELHFLDQGMQANFYLLSAYLHATLRHDAAKARAYTDSLLMHHAANNPGDYAMNYLDTNNIVEIYAAIGDTANSWQLIRYMDAHPVEPVSRYSHQLNINKARLFDLCGINDSAKVYAEKILGVGFNESIDAYNRSLAYRILMKGDSLRSDLVAYSMHRDSLDHLRYEIQGNHKKCLIATVEGRSRAEGLIKDMKVQKAQSVLWILAVVFAAILILAVVLWKYHERKARHRIAVLECSRLAAEVKSSQLMCERLEGEVKTRTDELSRHISEKDELTRQLRKAMSDVAAISPIDHLRLRLNQDHPEFMSLLGQRFPELSPNDRLILGAIKEGLSPKEIASALSISHSSLLTARYRLRKKLALDSSTNLDEFVASLK